MPNESFIDPTSARLAVVGRLTSGALHEIGNPLLALIGTAELAAGSVDVGSRLRERLDLIAGTANEIADVVRTLQRVTRFDPGERSARIDLSADAAAALELVRRLSPGRGGGLEGTFPEAPAFVEARPGALLLALAALLLAALESAPQGTVALVVSRGDGVASAAADTRASDDLHALAAAAGATLAVHAGRVELILPSSP